MNTKGFSIYSILLVFWVLLCWCAPSVAAQGAEMQVRVSYSRYEQIPLAVLTLTLAPEYHAYAHSQGATGKPTVLTFSPPRGVKTDSLDGVKVLYPPGKKQQDMFAPDATVRVYEGSVPVFVRLDGLPAGTELRGEVDALLCSSKHCLPVVQNVRVQMPSTPVAALPPLEGGGLTAWRTARVSKAPVFVESDADVDAPAGDIPPVTSGLPSLHKKDAPAGSGAVPAPQTGLPDLKGGQSVGAGNAVGLGGEYLQSGIHPVKGPWRLAPRPMHEDLEVSSLGKALLLGLLAGLLLNCMPCVLPVLTLKSSAMFVVGQGCTVSRSQHFRQHNLLFAAGIMTQFLILALVLGMAGLIWGQLFQSATLVTAMLIIVFLLGLSMLGVFTLPVIDLKADAPKSPRLNAYLTGIMATLLATPCSGPLLGGVLSWAFTQPLPILVLVFLAVGVGMSAPYLLFAFRPNLAVYLPRPGAWMSVLERLVGFFLLGTALYLLSILPQERHLPLLAALLVVAVGGWIWGRFGGLGAPQWRRQVLGAGLVVLTLGVVLYASQPPAEMVRWADFDVKNVRTLMGKRPLLVEFTADWCPNCKFVEQTVFTQDRLRRWQKKYDFQLVRVDLTRKNGQAEAFLQALGSSSIPLTALFPVGSDATSPIVLRDIYSAATLEQAMRRAFDGGVARLP